MAIVVQKYGGSSVADISKIQKIAKRIVTTMESGNRVVAVVSAMGNTTNELLSLAGQITAAPPGRELDMLVTVGERITMALLSMAIQELGHQAVSFTGSQSGILTTASHSGARVVEVRPYRIQDELERGKIVIVAGYQGVSYQREITTLGRGGSDTTAIALAAALQAEYCEICSDVDGVMTADPRVVTDAKTIDQLSHDEMLDMALAGARVLNADAMEYARRHSIAVYARSTFAGPESTGTLVRKDLDPDRGAVTAVVGRRDVCSVAVKAHDSRAFLTASRSHGLPNPIQTHTQGTETLLFFTSENAASPAELRAWLEKQPGTRVVNNLGMVTLIGPGVFPGSHLLQTLETEAGLQSAQSISISPGKCQWVIPEARVDEMVRTLHAKTIQTSENL